MTLKREGEGRGRKEGKGREGRELKLSFKGKNVFSDHQVCNGWDGIFSGDWMVSSVRKCIRVDTRAMFFSVDTRGCFLSS